MKKNLKNDTDLELWEMESEYEGDRKLLTMILIPGICILSALVVVFTVYIKNNRNHREAMKSEIYLQEIEILEQNEEEGGSPEPENGMEE